MRKHLSYRLSYRIDEETLGGADLSLFFQINDNDYYRKYHISRIPPRRCPA
ncbi:MAG: hypothetical protein FWH07_05875 [Oscillospiraceae bacterium]|nr:hypothetical protein [Oscillospiraceae bacterium]